MWVGGGGLIPCLLFLCLILFIPCLKRKLKYNFEILFVKFSLSTELDEEYIKTNCRSYVITLCRHVLLLGRSFSFLSKQRIHIFKCCYFFWWPVLRRPSVRLSVLLSVNFSHCHLLQNYCANFNQTWHKASLGGGKQVCLNEGPRPFQRGEKCKNVKVY